MATLKSALVAAAAVMFMAVLSAAPTDEVTKLADARNPRSTPARLNALYKTATAPSSVDTDVLKALAGNPATPRPLLVKIDKFGMPFSSMIYFPIYEALGGNPHTPAQILERLSSFPDTSVKQAVAANKSTPKKVLGLMASDKDVSVRLKVCTNPRTAPATLKKLEQDESGLVRAEAKRQLDLLKSKARQ